MHRNELPRIGCQHRRPGLRLTTFALLVAISATALAAPIGNGRRIAAAPGNSSSASAPLVAVRKSDNMLIVQGKPFFPIGIYEAPRTDAAMSRPYCTSYCPWNIAKPNDSVYRVSSSR